MIVAKSLISVGLPVYNGEEFVDNVIESVLEQDYRELELIICDNASSDATARICQEWAERDNRVRYYRNEENIGALANFERTLKLARGSYFNWVGHDDAFDPTYLSEVVTYLEAHPDVVLCASDFRGVDRQLGVQIGRASCRERV